jgi:hypothetical protein
MAKGIIEDVVKYAIKSAVEHAFAATQVMAMNNTVVASTLAGDATKAASATASGAAGIASQAANALRSITIDAAKTFGGVFGFLAPLLGPSPPVLRRARRRPSWRRAPRSTPAGPCRAI